MRVAISSVIVLDVPDDGTPLYEVVERFRKAHEAVEGIPMQTITGQTWTLVAVERFQGERRD